MQIESIYFLGLSVLQRYKYEMLSEFNIILKTWSDIVSDQPEFWSDMHDRTLIIILKRDVVSGHMPINQNRNNYQKSKIYSVTVYINYIKYFS